LLDLTQQSADDYLQGPLKQLESAGVAATAQVQRGDPAHVIARAANEIQADLIVLGTHGKAGMDAFWEGSMTPQIAQQTPVPMLLVRVHEARQD
jgi:nucleotide-binding universal stress UspA family protein